MRRPNQQAESCGSAHGFTPPWVRPRWLAASPASAASLCRHYPRKSGPGHKTRGGRDHRRGTLVNRVDDLGVINPAQVRRRDRDVGMPELPLYDQQRDTLTRHLDCVRMPLLVRRDPTSNTGGMSRGVELDTDPRGRTRPPAGRPPQHAEQRPDREGGTEFQPRVQLLLIPTSE